jgi:hypothetical protein
MIKLTTRRTKWFVLPQDESGETAVEILHLKPGKLAEIESLSNKVIGRTVRGKFDAEIDIDPHVRMTEIIKASIVDWKGFLNESGKPMKCTDANKLKVLNDFDWFFAQIELFRTELAEEVEAEQEEAEKN